MILPDYQFEKGPNRNRSDESQAQHQEHDEEHESSDILFSHAVVDPGAVMVVLRDADLTDVTVVGSFWLPPHAL